MCFASGRELAASQPTGDIVHDGNAQFEKGYIALMDPVFGGPGKAPGMDGTAPGAAPVAPIPVAQPAAPQSGAAGIADGTMVRPLVNPRQDNSVAVPSGGGLRGGGSGLNM